MILRLEFETSWDERKIRMAEVQIRRFLGQMRGVSHVGELRFQRLDASGAPFKPPPPPAVRLLQLICQRFDVQKNGPCHDGWEAQFFQPCPNCGGKKWVKKVGERMSTPSNGSPPPTPESIPADPSGSPSPAGPPNPAAHRSPADESVGIIEA